MGNRPEGMSIDRKDNEGDYTPENCKWSTRIEQENNKRSNRKITYKGKTMNLIQWARFINVDQSTIHYRLDVLSWPIGRALGYEGKQMAKFCQHP